MPNEEDRKWLYAQFKDNGYDTGSYDDFIKSLDNDEDFEWWHNEATSLGLEVGDLDEFGSLFRTPKGGASPSAQAQAPALEEEVTESFDDEPDLGAITDKNARRRAEKEAERERKEAERQARQARKDAPKGPDMTRMSARERTKAFNERAAQMQARTNAKILEQPGGEEVLEQNASEVAQRNQARKQELARQRQTKADVEAYGTGNEKYSFEEAVEAGKAFAEIAPQVERMDQLVSSFNDRYRDLEDRIEQLNAGKLQLTPEEYADMQREYAQYQQDSQALRELSTRYDEILASAPGKEYKEISERMQEIAKGPKSADSILEYANEYAALQRNPLYRAAMGKDAPSEDEIQAGALQSEIAYYEEKMKGAKGSERKDLKDRISNAKRLLYANPWYRQHLDAKIAENEAASTDISARREARAQEINAQYPGLDMDNRYAMQKADSEINLLDAAGRMREDAIREYRNPTKYDDSRFKGNVAGGLLGWAKGMADDPFSIEHFTEDIAVVRPVLDKVQGIVGAVNEDLITDGMVDALEEKLTPGELAVLDAYFEKVGAESAKGADTAIGYQIGQGIGDMIELGIEMIATGGVGGLVRGAVESGTKKAMIKLLGKRAYRKAARSGLGRVALWASGKAVADVAETAVRLPFMPSTYKAIGEGSVTLDSDYKVRPLGEYAPESLWNQYVEQLTEVSNGFAFPLIGKVVKTPGMTKFINGMIGDDAARAMRSFFERGDIKLLDDAMIGSFGGEWEEELLGAVIHSITDDPNALRDFFSAEQQLVLLGTLAPIPVTRGVVGGVSIGVPAAKADIAWGRAEAELKKAGFDDGRIARLKEVIDNAPVPEAARAVMEAYGDAFDGEWAGFRTTEKGNSVLRGSMSAVGADVNDEGGLYDKLAHYFWASQQKRAAGLMREYQEDQKIAAKKAELEERFGGAFYHDGIAVDGNGDSVGSVVEKATIFDINGNPLNIFITSESPNANNEMAYVGEDGSRGFVTSDELVSLYDDGLYHRGGSEIVDLDEYLAGLVMEDAGNRQLEGMVNEAVAGNRSLREMVEGLEEITYNGERGTLTRANEDGAVFVPDDASKENTPVTWAELAEQNGIEVPEVQSQAERDAEAAAAVAERYRLQQTIADSVHDAMNSGFDEAYIDTDEGRAVVIDIISDTIDPDAGTAQFTVQLEDGRKSVTMAMPIEPVLSQLRGEVEPWEEPEPAPAEPAEEGGEPPVEEGVESKIPLDENGNPIYDAPGVSVEDALEEMYSTEGLEDEDIDDYIMRRAAEAEKGRDVKQGKMSLKEWGQAKKEANRVADFWGELKQFAEANRKSREEAKKKEAERQAIIDKYGVDVRGFDLNPMTLDEVTADILGSAVGLIDLDDAIRETVGRRKDGRVPTELFRHVGKYGILTKKGGQSIQDVATDIVREFYGDLEHDDLADGVRSDIIDMLLGNTKSELKDYIFNKRLDAARKEAEELLNGQRPPAGPPATPAAQNPPVAPAPKPEPAPQPPVAPNPPASPAGPTAPTGPTAPAAPANPSVPVGNGENNGGNAGNNGGNSVPLGGGVRIPASPAEITTVEEARAYFEAKYGKGKSADNRVRMWEMVNGRKGAKAGEGNGMNQMALSVEDTGLSAEESAELEQIGIQVAVEDIEDGGFVKFPAFFKNMVENFGDGIRPFVKAIYLGASAKVDDDIADQMDDRKAVRAFDIEIDLNDIKDGQDITDIQPEAGGESPAVADDGAGEGSGSGEAEPSDAGSAPADNETGEGGQGDLFGEGTRETDNGSDGGRTDGTPGNGEGDEGRADDGKRTGRGSKGNRGRGRPGAGESADVGRKPAVKTEEELEKEAAEEEQKAYESEKESIKSEEDVNKLKNLKDELKAKISEIKEKFNLEKARMNGRLRAVIERLRELFSTNAKKAEALEQEKVPYVATSDPAGEHAIGSVVPSGSADAMRDAIRRLEAEEGKSVAEFVKDELGYKSLDEMFSSETKNEGLSSEQVDSVGLAIQQMKKGKMFIIGDMTGIGKGRQGAALIRWAKRQGKKVLFVTEKPDLFSDMYQDLKDIGSDGFHPWIVNDDAKANITDKNSEADEKTVIVQHPGKAEASNLYKSDSDELPAIKGKKYKGKKYDFVMMTYSQAQGARTAAAERKLNWIKTYAKDAIVICDESHNASGDSNRGKYFQDIVRDAQGVTFSSATFAKRPDNMVLYAIRSSIGDVQMTQEDLVEAIRRYGIPMQEILAASLFKTGEMVRRERDFSDVKTHWHKPEEIYTEDEIKQCRQTFDKTIGVVNEIIDVQRRAVMTALKKKNEEEFKDINAAAAMKLALGEEATFYEYATTPYSGQVSNVAGLMYYAVKAQKAADMAIEQIKRGEKPVIAVENTLDSYLKEIKGDVPDADFAFVLNRGLKTATSYRLKKTVKKVNPETGKVETIKEKSTVDELGSVEPILGETAIAMLDGVRESVRQYSEDKSVMPLMLSPIDYIKKRISDAGYKCGEITGRGFQLVQAPDGSWHTEPFSADKKKEISAFNGGQTDALILNTAGSTGISLHASKRFKDQRKRNMIILQPARDPNTEVQIRGRVDRTGQVSRAEYFYITSPIPAEQKIIMMLRQKLASLDANSVGTENVSSNRVNADDMDNKYGDEIARQFLIDHQEINAQLDRPIQEKKGEYEHREGLLYELLIGLQRMECEVQEMALAELQDAYREQIEYLNQNGINDLATTTMNLDAVTIDTGVFIKGKDNESMSVFAHDTLIERVEVNVLNKPLRSSDINERMRKLGAIDADGKLKKDYGSDMYDGALAYIAQAKKDRAQKYADAEAKLEKELREQYPKPALQSQEEYDREIAAMPQLSSLKNKNAEALSRYNTDLDKQSRAVFNAQRYLKPGMPMLVPLTDDVKDNAPMSYGRFIGFKIPKDGKPKGIKAVFAVKDSRASIEVPIISKADVIQCCIDNTYGNLGFGGTNLRDIGGSYYESSITEEDRRPARDEWWDKMIPKDTNRQIRYMVTGNVLQACGSLGKYKGTITTFTRKDPDTGEITVERGMLLAEDFDPENFEVRSAVTKEDVWDGYDQVRDNTTMIGVRREGDKMIVTIDRKGREKLANHPLMKDAGFKELIDNNVIDAYSRDQLRAYVSEENVEKVLDYLYRNYAFTKGHLFVMPDSTERVDKIVYTDRPYQEIIDEFSVKYGASEWSIENMIKKAVANYKMDVNNEDLKTKIRELVQLRQAYYRKRYANEESSRLAWSVIIYDEEIERQKNDKEARDKAFAVREAIKEELAERGVHGNEMHFESGKVPFDFIIKTFNELNSDKDKAELAKRIFAIVKKLNTDVFFNEKIQNSTGGQTLGEVIEYNWKYMNADWITDQMKADTILHELIHTVTTYAQDCVRDGYDHLISEDVVDAVQQLDQIYNAIRNNKNFEHKTSESASPYRDYGVKDRYEMLTEAGSNSIFQDDLKKTTLGVKVMSGMLTFSDVTTRTDYTGKTQNAFDAIMERLNVLIDNFNEHAFTEYFRGTRYGQRGYYRGRGTENLRNPVDRAKAITAVNDMAKKLGVKFEQDSSLKAKGVFSPTTGKIRINIDAHKDTADLEATLLHEAVAHYGLRKLFGDEWKEVRRRLYDRSANSIKAKVDAIAKEHGLSREVAMEEYIASLAEDGAFDRQEESFWKRIVTEIKRLLAKLGLNADYFTDEDFRAMLYASYRNLQTGGALERATRMATYQALRKSADASHEDNGPEDDGPDGGGNPTGGEEEMLNKDPYAEPFYSNAKAALGRIRMDKATPEQWLKMLEKEGGLKAGEDKWLGLSDWLKSQSKKSLTRQEVEDYIAQNEIKVEEVNYSENGIMDEDDMTDFYNELPPQLDLFHTTMQEEFDDLLEDMTPEEAYDVMAEKYGEKFEECYDRDETIDNESLQWDYIDPLLELAGFKNEGEENDDWMINATRLTLTTKGLTNKREIALTVPSIGPWNEYDDIHFGDAGDGRAVAWIRFGDTFVDEEIVVNPEDKEELERLNKKVHDAFVKAGDEPSEENTQAFLDARDERDAFAGRTDARGGTRRRRVLVIDEIQSKRHEDARELFVKNMVKKYGEDWKDKATDEEKEAGGYYAGRSVDELRKERDASLERYDRVASVMKKKYGGGVMSNYDLWPEVTEEDKKQIDDVVKESSAIAKELNEALNGIPRAPFEKNWHELAMKRMLRYAAENGYDYVAWTTGDQQVERYELGGVVKKIEWRPKDESGVESVISLKDGKNISFDANDSGEILWSSQNDLVGKDISDVVGKEIATKMLADESGSIDGEGLRIGGEGMKGFYDDILPRFMNKYGKKWGVKVSDIHLPNLEESAQTMHAVPVTSEMAESVLRGQPLFRFIGEKGAANADEKLGPIERRMETVEIPRKGISKILGKKFQNVETAITRVDNLNIAKKMQSEGVDPAAIKRATGWEVGKDGQWRYEESDVRLNGELFEKVKGMPLDERRDRKFSISEVLVNDDSYNALISEYPELEEVKVQFYNDSFFDFFNATRGYYDEKTKTLMLNPKGILFGNDPTAEDLTSIVIHELQHVIQGFEGFARGGNTSIVDKYGRVGELQKRGDDIELQLQSVLESNEEYKSLSDEIDRKQGEFSDEYVEHKRKQAEADAEYDRKKREYDEAHDRAWDLFEKKERELSIRRRKGEISLAKYLELYDELEKEREASIPEYPHIPMYHAFLGEMYKYSYEDLKPLKDRLWYLKNEIMRTSEEAKSLNAEKDKLRDELRSERYRLYQSIAGETEARNVQARAKMTDEERRNSLAESTEDVQRAEQILLFDEDTDTSASIAELPDDIRKDAEDLAIDQEDTELYRRASDTATALTAAEQYNSGVRTVGNAVREVLVDEYVPVDRLEDALAEESGSPLKDDERTSNLLREVGGKAMHAVKEYDRKFLQPMWSAVGEFRKKTGESIENIVRYVGLKSGLERNIVLAKRDAKKAYEAEYDSEVELIDKEEKEKKRDLDKKLKKGEISDVTYAGQLTALKIEMDNKRESAKIVRDGHFLDVDTEVDPMYLEFRKKDYSAITAWAETDDLERAEAMATDYVNDMEARSGKAAARELWKRINAATKETLKFQYEHDMLTRQQYTDIASMMKYYVPMRGFADNTAEDLYNYYVTAQSDDFKPTLLTAKGRRTLYESPLGNIGAMHSSAVSQGIKNTAKLSLLDAVRRRPKNTIATVTRAWFVKNGQKDEDGKDIYEVAYPAIKVNATLAEREAAVEAFETEMAEKRANGEAYNSHREVDLRGGVVAFEKESHKSEHTVKVREGGKEYGIIINGNPAAAQAINGVKRGTGMGETILNGFRWGTRFISQMFTTLSVPFWVSNFQRDQGQGLTNTFIRNKPGYLGRYILNRFRAFKVFPMIVNEERFDAMLAEGDPVAKLYKQYLENGGPMGQNRIEDNDYYDRKMRRYLGNTAKQGIVKGAQSVFDFISGVGEAVETVTRFAVFITSMEEGRPIHQSVSDAKEVSTNFARKGRGRTFTADELDRMGHADGTPLGPMERGLVKALSALVEICRAMIPFFNAAVQGLDNKITNYRNKPGKTLIANAIYFGLGLGMKLWLMNAGGDDDKEWYSHISDYVRRNNLNTPLGNGVYAKWALPQEYRFWFQMGDLLASAVTQERPLEDLGIDAFGALAQLSPIGVVTDEVVFNPKNKKEAYQTLLTNITPGVGAPVVEAAFNRDFKGARIYNQGFNDNLLAYPGYRKALPTTGKGYVNISKFLNDISGGDDVQPGVIDELFPNPAVVEHLVDSYFSGPYQLVVKLPVALGKTAKGIYHAVDEGNAKVIGDYVKIREVPLLNRILLNTNDNQRDAFYSNMYYYFKEKNTEAERINGEYKNRERTGKVADFYGSKDYRYMLVFKKYEKIESTLRKAAKNAESQGDEANRDLYDGKLQDVQYAIAKECLDIYFDRLLTEDGEVK